MGEFRKHAIPLDILDELAARFIINIPHEERRDLIRVCFQIEAAHWFYIDFYVDDEDNKKLKLDQRLHSGTMKEFAAHIFQHVPFLQSEAHRVEEVIEEWREYKLAVPTFGAIIINTFLDKVLLVQGYMGKGSWGFPKGKVNEDEPPHVCAVREVLEETGFDIGELIDPEEYLEQVINDQTVRLYLVHGVTEDTKFEPQTRCEIRDLQWFAVNLLPTSKSDLTSKNKLGIPPNSFFMVIPFLRDLKKWVLNKQRERLQFTGEETGKVRSKRKSESRDKIGRTKKEQESPSVLTRVNSSSKKKNESNQTGRQRRESEKGNSSTGRQRKISRQNSHKAETVDRQGNKVEPPDIRQTGKADAADSSRKTGQGDQTSSRVKADGRLVDKNEAATDSRSRTSVERAVSENRVRDKVSIGKSKVKQSRRQLLFEEVRRSQEKQEEDRHNRKENVDKEEEGRVKLKPIFDDDFCPEAWKNFRLNHEEILMAAFGLPTNFSATVKGWHKKK